MKLNRFRCKSALPTLQPELALLIFSPLVSCPFVSATNILPLILFFFKLAYNCLQCVSFCCTVLRISRIYASTPALQAVAEHSAELPVRFSRSPLAVCLHMVVCRRQCTLSIHATLSLPRCAHKSVRCVCASVPTLEADSFVPFF